MNPVLAAVVCAVTLWLLASPGAPAMPQPDSRPALLAPQERFDRIAAFYSKPWSERVRVTALDTRGPAQRATYAAVCVPSREPGEGELRLELADLRVQIVGGTLLAANRRDDTTCFEADVSNLTLPAAVAKYLPPVPLPQLIGSGAPAPDITPWSKGVTWSDPPNARTGGPSKLSGSFLGGAAELIARPSDAGFARITAAFDPPTEQGLRRIELQFTRETAPVKWELSGVGRRRVGSLAELRPSEEPPPRDPIVDALSLMDANTYPWSLEDAFSASNTPPGFVTIPAAPGASESLPVLGAVLVVFRVPEGGAPDAARTADVAGAFDAINLAVTDIAQREPRPAGGKAIRLLIRPVAITDFAAFRDEIGFGAAAWWVANGPTFPALKAGDQQPIEILCSATAELTLEKAAPGASAALLVIGPDMRLYGTAALDGPSGDPVTVGSALSRAITQMVNAAVKSPPRPAPPPLPVESAPPADVPEEKEPEGAPRR